jgi:hypothetical protein
VSAFRQLTVFTVSAALLVATACLIWSAVIPVDRACEASGGSPCTHDTPLLFGLGIEVVLLLFYVVMVVGLAAKTRRDRRR